jgi:acetoin utilization deacetylase AcuC-like enzyme
MSVLVATHDLCWLHDPGAGHPERADRLTAVKQGITSAGLDDAVQWIAATDADRSVVERVHPSSVLNDLVYRCENGPHAIDPDTIVSKDSANAAFKAAGAGLDLVAALDRGEAAVGWSMVRPPGHHALPRKQMGFCLINNVAVTARFLADRGERVAIVDIDAHHGNGTQEIFYDDPDVLFVSLHQYPWYPYTGALDEVGEGAGRGHNVNIPMPAGATGEAYRAALDRVVLPVLDRFRPTWMLVSAGFDGHRRDPLTELSLSSADYADLVAELLPVVPAGRRLLFLEGGYDLQALVHCGAAVIASSNEQQVRPEEATSGGPGLDAVEAARRVFLDGGPGDPS